MSGRCLLPDCESACAHGGRLGPESRGQLRREFLADSKLLKTARGRSAAISVFLRCPGAAGPCRALRGFVARKQRMMSVRVVWTKANFFFFFFLPASATAPCCGEVIPGKLVGGAARTAIHQQWRVARWRIRRGTHADSWCCSQAHLPNVAQYAQRY